MIAADNKNIQEILNNNTNNVLFDSNTFNNKILNFLNSKIDAEYKDLGLLEYYIQLPMINSKLAIYTRGNFEHNRLVIVISVMYEANNHADVSKKGNNIIINNKKYNIKELTYQQDTRFQYLGNYDYRGTNSIGIAFFKAIPIA